MWHDDGEPLAHVIIVENHDANHNSRSYRVQLIKTGRLVTGNAKYLKPTVKSVYKYLQEQN